MLPKKAVILSLALILSACGYHLRGALELPGNMKNIYVEGGSAPLHDQFQQIVKSSSTQLSSSRKGAGLIIKIYDEDFSRRSLSLSSRGKSNEFELYYHFDYELVDAGGNKMTDRQTVEIRREYYNDQSVVIAKDNEETVIRGEMYQQAVYAIFNRARIVLAVAGGK